MRTGMSAIQQTGMSALRRREPVLAGALGSLGGLDTIKPGLRAGGLAIHKLKEVIPQIGGGPDLRPRTEHVGTFHFVKLAGSGGELYAITSVGQSRVGSDVRLRSCPFER